jgi:outer membrane lipoprotein-sorting protein
MLAISGGIAKEVPMSLAPLTRRTVLAALFAGMMTPGGAYALTDEQSSALREISTSLSQVQTMNGEFVQFNPNGEQLQGQFYIARPGRVRFQYDEPSATQVIADGKSVLVHDKKMQTYDIWPLSQTPLRLLLDSSLELATSDKVTNVGVAPDLIEVVLQDETRFSAGTLNLIFDRTTHELRQWTVTDRQGLQTMVALYNVEVGNSLNEDLFEIDYQAAAIRNRENR